MSEPGIYNIVVGTAGHIDHGKSSLVRALTGIDPDRLPEEKDRGLTIDLGFAPLVLSSGMRVGIIDVPGHEKFVKNMVAGATGIDLVMLVVAADDSVMPQTREHLDIMSLLGLRRGVIVINKIDLVEPEMADLVEEEIRETVRGSFLDNARAFRVSAVTGAGLDELRRGLEEEILKVPPHSTEGVFRMSIQRVFSAKGHGTIVTGIPISGKVELGDRLEVLPLGQQGRVRGLQAYKLTVTSARAGHSTAMNLSDLDYHDIRRGMVVATPGYFRPTTMLEAVVRVLPHLRMPVRHQTAIRFHTGTIEVTGTIYLLQGKTIEPGREAYAQFRFDEPVVVAPGDRYVFRQESPMLTLGGGEILDRSTWRLKTGKDYVLKIMERKQSALGSREDFIASVTQEAPFRIVEAKEVATHAGMPVEEVKEVIAKLVERGDLIEVGGGRGWFTREGIELGEKRVLHEMHGCYERDPYRIYLPKLELRDAAHLDANFFEALIAWLDEKGKLRSLRGGRLALPGRELALKPEEKKAYEVMLKNFREKLFAPPDTAELAQTTGRPSSLLDKLQGLLVDEEQLVRVSSEFVFHRDAMTEGAVRLKKLFGETGPFSASQARVALDTSRKFIIPLLEHFDHLKITRRVGDLREMA